MGIAQGYWIGKDLGQTVNESKYQAGLSAIKTPQQRAAERAEQEAQSQSAARVAQQGLNPVPQQSTADLIGSGGIMPQQPAPAIKPIDTEPTLNDQIDYLSESSQYAVKHGKLDPADLVKLQTTVGNMRAEGLTKAIKSFNGGDDAGGIKSYNASGKHRVKLVGSQNGEEVIGGVKVPTRIITFEDESGNRETVNTARYLHSMAGIEAVVKTEQDGAKIGQEDRKQGETQRHNMAEEGIAKTTAEEKLIDAKNASADTKSKRGADKRLSINDGVKMLDTAYGIKRDPLTQAIDTNSIKDKSGYYRDAAEMEMRVNAGESPMMVASEIAERAMRTQKTEGTTKPSGTPKKLW